MNRRSKGVQEFAQPTTDWDIRSQLRFMAESGRNVSYVISPDWCPISPVEPIISQKELTPWLSSPRMSEICSWEEDFWMTQTISSLSHGRNLLTKVYDTLIERDEIEFYTEYIPIRWYYNGTEPQDFDETLDKFKCANQSTVIAGNFAISEEFVRPLIMERAKEFGIKINRPKALRTILWARRDMLVRHLVGRAIINYWKSMDERALKFGIPSYPLHINLIFERL